eukprot:6470173-Amphidinium_carterae.1
MAFHPAMIPALSSSFFTERFRQSCSTMTSLPTRTWSQEVHGLQTPGTFWPAPRPFAVLASACTLKALT